MAGGGSAGGCSGADGTGWIGKVGVVAPEKFGSQYLSLLQSIPSQTFSAELRALKKASVRAVLRIRLGVDNPERYGNLSQNGVLSPELGGWPIYSTSFSSLVINGLTKWLAREVRNLFAYQTTDTRRVQMLASPSTHH